MAKYIAVMIFVIVSRSPTESTRGRNKTTATVCDRAVRFMFDKVFWDISYRLTDVLQCLECFGYKDLCQQGRCPSVQVGYCPFESKWEINYNKVRNSSDTCFVVGECRVYLTSVGMVPMCNRTTDDSNDSSICSTQYCNGRGRCVLTSDYNLACNCSRDYYGEHCRQAVEAKECDTEKIFTTVQMAVAAGSSTIAGILLMSAVVCVCRLRSHGKPCFRKQKEQTEDASNSVTMKIIQPSTKEQSDDNNQVRDIDIACDSVPGKSQLDPIYLFGSDSEK